MTPRPRARAAPRLEVAGAAAPRREPATGGVRWLHPVDRAPRVVDGAAVGRRLDAAGVHDPAEWRAAQLTLLLLGVDLDAGPGETAARWSRGVPGRSFDLASRAGISEGEVERALDSLLRAEVVAGDDPRQLASSATAVGQHAAVLRVRPEYVTDGPAAAVAWGVVTEHLAGSAAALLVTRTLADLIERPGRPTVVPYSALVRGTRYSEGMVKRGVSAAVAAGIVIQRASRGRAPAYAFSDWALGRVEPPARGQQAGEPSSAALDSGVSLPTSERRPALAPSVPQHGPASAPATLRASVAGVSVEVPAVTGGELVVETVVDGRAVTARLTIPAMRT